MQRSIGSLARACPPGRDLAALPWGAPDPRSADEIRAAKTQECHLKFLSEKAARLKAEAEEAEKKHTFDMAQGARFNQIKRSLEENKKVFKIRQQT